MKFTYFIAFLIVSILSACDNKPPDPGILNGKIREIAKLATVDLQISKVIYGVKELSYTLLPNPKDATFFARANVNIQMGIDLKKIRENDIKIKEKSIRIELPAVELINFSMPAESIVPDYYYSQDNSWLNKIELNHIDAFYRQAEDDIRESLKYLGAIEEAEDKTYEFMEGFLIRMGFEEIDISFKKSEESFDADGPLGT